MIKSARARTIVMPVVLLLVALVMPQSAAAGALFIFFAEIGDECVSGVGPGSTQITARLRSAAGTLQGKVITTTDSSSGSWVACFDYPVDPGDVVSATDGSSPRSLTIPPLELNLLGARVDDVVAGRGPASSNVTIDVYDCHDFSCDFVTASTVGTSATGAFTRDFTAQHNIRGEDKVELRWASGFGDVLSYNREVPKMIVSFGHAWATGKGHPSSQVTLKLRKANGDLRGTMKDAGDEYSGSFQGHFRNGSGALVDPAATDRIVGSFATDAKLTVIDPMLAGNATSNVVSGKCYPNQPYYVSAREPYETTRTPSETYFFGTAGSTGNFSVDIAAMGEVPGFDLVAGDLLYVACRSNKGDVLWVLDEV